MLLVMVLLVTVPLITLCINLYPLDATDAGRQVDKSYCT